MDDDRSMVEVGDDRRHQWLPCRLKCFSCLDPGQVYAWISPDLPTGPDDVFYVGMNDDPHESRSLAPGNTLPYFGTGGKRVKGRVGQGKDWTIERALGGKGRLRLF